MLTQQERAQLRAWTLQARDQCHPHGDGCWHVHWPCRVLHLLDAVDALESDLRTTRSRAESESEGAQSVIAALQRKCEFLAGRYAKHLELLHGLQGDLSEAITDLERLHA